MEATKLFTASEYRVMEDDGCRYEVIHGELIMAPVPNRYHQVVSRNLCRILYPFIHKKKLGAGYNAPLDVFLDEHNVVQPDFVFVKKSNSNAREVAEGLHGSPDFAVEILSPSTSKRDLKDKRKLYQQFGTTEFWVIDPKRFVVQVFLFKVDPEQPTRTYQREETLESLLFPGLKISVAELFEEA